MNEEDKAISKRKLVAFGYKVMDKEAPVAWSDLDDNDYKKGVNKSGCCGFDEFIKLNAWGLTDYYRVLHSDADALILDNLDELWDEDPKVSLIHVPGTMAGEMFSGGFIVARPDLGVLDRMTSLIKKGDFRPGSAWEGMGIGWYWGGSTVQGFVPYFFHKKMPQGSVKVLEHCRYINLGAHACLNYSWSETRIYNFGPKPFECVMYPTDDMRPVARAHRMWWEMLMGMADSIHVKRPPRCVDGHEFKAIDLDAKV